MVKLESLRWYYEDSPHSGNGQRKKGWEEAQENTVSRGDENGIKCQMLPRGKGK